MPFYRLLKRAWELRTFSYLFLLTFPKMSSRISRKTHVSKVEFDDVMDNVLLKLVSTRSGCHNGTEINHS